METNILKISEKSEGEFSKAAEFILSGEIVAFPTETVYGLGANGLDKKACEKIYSAKGRPSDNPLILHVANRMMVDTIAYVPTVAELIFAAFSPGPVTLILPKRACVPDLVTGGLKTVGVRIPSNSVARKFIEAANVPIAAPSANISGRPSPISASAVYDDLHGKIPLILDGGKSDVGMESTIVDCSGNVPTILRPGAITKEMLEEVVGEVAFDDAVLNEADKPKAPGMKYRHYAPRAPLTVFAGDERNMRGTIIKYLQEKFSEGKTVGVLLSKEIAKDLTQVYGHEYNSGKLILIDYGAQGDFEDIARHIYEGLRMFDETEATELFAEGVREEGLGIAIMNRLKKASSGKLIYV